MTIRAPEMPTDADSADGVRNGEYDDIVGHNARPAPFRIGRQQVEGVADPQQLHDCRIGDPDRHRGQPGMPLQQSGPDQADVGDRLAPAQGRRQHAPDRGLWSRHSGCASGSTWIARDPRHSSTVPPGEISRCRDQGARLRVVVRRRLGGQPRRRLPAKNAASQRRRRGWRGVRLLKVLPTAAEAERSSDVVGWLGTPGR